MAIFLWHPKKSCDDIHHHWNGDFAVDVYENEKQVIVEMNTPGIDPEKIDIEVDDTYLRICGTREEQQETEDKNFYQKEISRGSFERVISLPTRVSAQQTTAAFNNGMLKICLPKQSNRSAEKIKVTKP